MYIAELISPYDLRGFGGTGNDYSFTKEIIEGCEEELALDLEDIYSIGWSDSDNIPNDEAVYVVTELLHTYTGDNLGCAHPQSFEPSKVVDYKGHKILVSAGPNLLASLEAFALIAKDAGIGLAGYKTK